MRGLALSKTWGKFYKFYKLEERCYYDYLKKKSVCELYICDYDIKLFGFSECGGLYSSQKA